MIDPIDRALSFIEENLTEELPLSRIASEAGYSEYHFLRLFRQKTGLTPADYIRKRRLTEAVRRIGGGTIADAAFASGFNSKENFTRAFKAEHHILPTELREAQNSLHLKNPPRAPIPVEGRIERLEPFTLIVLPSDEPHPPSFWNKYNARGFSKRLSGGRDVTDYGVSLWDAAAGRLDYFIGMRACDALGDRTGTLELRIPGGEYAVFDTMPTDTYRFVEVIRETWTGIRAWLPEHGYARTGGAEFECYIESSRTFTERIYVPVMEKK